MDSGHSTTHQELAGNSKSITTYGTLVAATGEDPGTDHGLFVTSIAAGEDDGTGMQGVAPSASLHLSDYANKNGETDFATHWASATDAAATANAIVQNNSWGGSNAPIATINTYMNRLKLNHHLCHLIGN